MKYKFKSQTGILVAGMLAATYASACFYSQTSAICFASGTTVDTIYWGGNGYGQGQNNVIASSDWWVNADGPSGYFYWSSPAVGTGNSNTTDDNHANPAFCSGPAHFLDKSGHNTSVNSWMANSANGGIGGGSGKDLFEYYKSGGVQTLVEGTVSGSTCN